MPLSKAEIVRRHLGTALALFLQDVDPVSVQTLAAAGSEIAEHLSKESGRPPFSTHVLSAHPEMSIGKYRSIQRAYSNALKHATTRDGQDRADDELLSEFNDEKNHWVLWIGWHDYSGAGNPMPIEAQVFQAWIYALYPEKLAPEIDTASYERIFPNLKNLSRQKQKELMRGAIKHYRQDDAIMGHPLTDRRPLILSAEMNSAA